jgi:hypothetical protein
LLWKKLPQSRSFHGKAFRRSQNGVFLYANVHETVTVVIDRLHHPKKWVWCLVFRVFSLPRGLPLPWRRFSDEAFPDELRWRNALGSPYLGSVLS